MKSVTSGILRPLAISLAFSFLAIFLVMRLSVGPQTWVALRDMDHWLFLYCLGMVVVAWSCNGVRLKLLSTALGYRIPLPRCIRITLSSEFAIAATPSGLGGGFLRIYLLRGQGVPVGEGMSMLAADMALDMLFSLLVIPLALPSFLSIFRPLLRNPLETISLTIVAVLVVVVVAGLLWYRWSGNAATSQTCTAAGKSAAKGVRAFLDHARSMLSAWSGEFRSGGSTLLHLRRPTLLATFLVAIIQWTCRYGVLVVILRALGYAVNPFALFLLQALLFFGGLLLVIPGGGGGVELAFFAAAAQFVPPGVVGVALVLWRFFTYYLYLLGGGAMLLLTVGKGGFSGTLDTISGDLSRAEYPGSARWEKPLPFLTRAGYHQNRCSH